MSLPHSHEQGYQYRRLEREKRTIRLLTFVDPDGDHGDIDEDDVPLSIHEHDLASGSVPDYIALSHTWGTSGRDVPVVVDGAKLNITASLNNALKHLKNLKVQQEDSPSYWWIDMICVNQHDDDERSHQVGMMQDIFKTAQHVVAWLGGTQYDDECKKFLQHIREVSPSTYPRFKREVSDEVNKGGWALLKHPWWSRLWIIQEVVLAREVTIACGDEMVPWATIRLFIRHLEASEPVLPQKMALNLIMLRDETRYADIRDSERSLSWLLTGTAYNSECTDPRDRLYALLGLVRDHDIVPDYSLSPCAVYCSAIQAIARAWSDDETIKIIRPFSHVSLEEEVERTDGCDGDQCGTWLCLLNIAQFDWETDSNLLKKTSQVHKDYITDPGQFWFRNFLFDDLEHQSKAHGEDTLILEDDPEGVPLTVQDLSGPQLGSVGQRDGSEQYPPCPFCTLSRLIEKLRLYLPHWHIKVGVLALTFHATQPFLPSSPPSRSAGLHGTTRLTLQPAGGTYKPDYAA